MEFTNQTVCNHFIERFKKEPIVVRSPGRINLIGEHTDYNDGYVMPAAIDKEIIFAIAPSDDSTSKVFALNFNEQVDFELKNPAKVTSPSWANYLLGVARQFVDRGHSLKPFVCVFGGNIPTGSGLSSSAALECGFAYALQELNSLNISRVELAKIGQWSEHNFVGVRCGIMDQFASMMGKENQVIQLDCRSMQYQYFPIQLTEHSIVLFNSGVKHSLASSEYNIRRAECEEGVTLLQHKIPSIKSLRDISLQMLEDSRNDLRENVFKRCKYIVEEIERVQLASADLLQNNLRAFGKRMLDTHDGLSSLYEVSCGELDYLVQLTYPHQEVLGSRMMGGGFGGCTINIIKQDAVDRIVDSIRSAYYVKFNIEIEAYIVQIKNGVSLMTS